MAYNKNVLSPEQAPQAWVDMLKPSFKGRKLIIQDSAAGTAFNQMYILERLLGVDFMRAWGAQRPIVVATAAQLIDLLARGEALVGATVDHFRAFEPDAVKAGIVGVYPSEGMPVALAPVAILQGAPHPNAARLFIDFTLSREGNTLLNHDIFNVYSPPRRRADTGPPIAVRRDETAAAAGPGGLRTGVGEVPRTFRFVLQDLTWRRRVRHRRSRSRPPLPLRWACWSQSWCWCRWSRSRSVPRPRRAASACGLC